MRDGRNEFCGNDDAPVVRECPKCVDKYFALAEKYQDKVKQLELQVGEQQKEIAVLKKLEQDHFDKTERLEADLATANRLKDEALLALQAIIDDGHEPACYDHGDLKTPDHCSCAIRIARPAIQRLALKRKCEGCGAEITPAGHLCGYWKGNS